MILNEISNLLESISLYDPNKKYKPKHKSSKLDDGPLKPTALDKYISTYRELKSNLDNPEELSKQTKNIIKASKELNKKLDENRQTKLY